MSLGKGYLSLYDSLVNDILDKFPNHPSRSLAKILYRDNPEIFGSIEGARSAIRTRRGANGDHNRKYLKNKNYVKQQSV